MSRMFISCETLTDWFNEFSEDQTDWIITEIIDNLCSSLADTNILIVDTTDKEASEKLQNINNGIVSALRDLKKLKNEVAEEIASGGVLKQGGRN